MPFLLALIASLAPDAGPRMPAAPVLRQGLNPVSGEVHVAQGDPGQAPSARPPLAIDPATEPKTGTSQTTVAPISPAGTDTASRTTVAPLAAAQTGRSSAVVQAQGRAPCTDPDNPACTEEELKALKERIRSEDLAPEPLLGVERITSDPGKAVQSGDLTNPETKAILLP